MEKRVGIVGAGISGLLACKYMLQKGFHPIVFEAKESIGGVWTHTIESTKLQTPREGYRFLDFPWPADVEDEFPNSGQVMEYIELYAQRFDLLRFIKFRSRVVSIEYDGVPQMEMDSWDLWGGTGDAFNTRGKWLVSVEDAHRIVEIYQVDFLILCIGRFSGIPNIPFFSPGHGPEVFNGQVMHSMDYSSLDNHKAIEMVKGKRVTVVGFQKSALDIAANCATINGSAYPCTLTYRTAHWNVQHYSPWGIHLAYLYGNRFSELMVHKPGEGMLLRLLATFLTPLRWAVSKFVESYLRWTLPLKKYGLVPKHSFSMQLTSCSLSTLPSNFYDKVEEGSIILKKSQSLSFGKNGVITDSKTTPLETDLVIFATGFKGEQKLKDIFLSPVFKEAVVGSSNTTVPLYRNCIHPRIPFLAIIGYSESISHLFTNEMRCRWLANFLGGEFQLPSIRNMEEDALGWEKFMKKYTGRFYRGSCIAGFHIWSNDQLCKEMGCSPTRKKGFLNELFSPYGPLDYADLK
ncbi:hypothetical protein H6P81_019043 [Aristolochia fimbriata]|uniref:Flavin-containing monooxygenase n=1 Tax=Aristolochia fimbriata TaxID=158543 RepID=A0AAV7E3V1_ARIFI|nr:hypothetical protein H6P81_019043 [Aristolochia fimbriata]